MGRPQGQGGLPSVPPGGIASIPTVLLELHGRADGRRRPPRSPSPASYDLLDHFYLSLNRNPNGRQLDPLAPLPPFPPSSPLLSPSPVWPFFSCLHSCRPLGSNARRRRRRRRRRAGCGWCLAGPGSSTVLPEGQREVLVSEKYCSHAHPAASDTPARSRRHPAAANGRLAEVMSYTCSGLRPAPAARLLAECRARGPRSGVPSP